MICVQTQAAFEEFRRNYEIGVFNESIDNSMKESLARIISNALCWYKCRTTNKMFYFGQLIPGTEMLWNKKCKATFGFEYISSAQHHKNIADKNEHCDTDTETLKLWYWVSDTKQFEVFFFFFFSSRNHHKATRRYAIKEGSKVGNCDWVNHKACSLFHTIHAVPNLFIRNGYFSELKDHLFPIRTNTRKLQHCMYMIRKIP